MKETNLNSAAMNNFLNLVEQSARSTEEGVKYFIEPSSGTLSKAINKRHHIIFGRRGSGKSSLIRKAVSDLTVDRVPIAFVDLEPFKNHTYPDLLISILIATFKSYKHWLDTAAIHPASKKTYWTWFDRRPAKSAYDKKKSKELSDNFQQAITVLDEQLHSSDQVDVEEKKTLSGKSSKSTDASLGVKAGPLNARLKEASNVSISDEVQLQEKYKTNKVEYLRRHIMDHQKLFDQMAVVSDSQSFLFLDDLYHIRKDDQASVVDYFHSIAKGHKLWIKIGTIKHRSKWYVHGDPPLGMKLGDDAEQIDLDLTLEKYSLAKDFLRKIIDKLASPHGVIIDNILTDGALDRLVLACGGVARDFLTIFRKAVDVARERDLEKITAEEVNVAAGDHDSTKRDELTRDTYSDEQSDLYSVFDEISSFCLDTTKTNCFLVDKDANTRKTIAIHELVDLKLIHTVRSRVTISKMQGKIYEAYMLDLSQYAGSRAKRGLSIVEFWKSDSKEQLRKISLVYNVL